MILGAAMGLLLISIFLTTVDSINPAWGKFWMIRPLLIVPLAGAIGAFCNYLIAQFYFLLGIQKRVAILISVIIFLFGLWMGFVVGLNGTLWD